MVMRADIVIPVYGRIDLARRCLESLRRATAPDHAVIVVDDATPAPGDVRLRQVVSDQLGAGTTVLRNVDNLGFLLSANRGVAAGSNDVVVLLNSDTAVPPGWLEGLVAALYSTDDIGVVTPLSNHASLTRVELPYGSNFLDMASAVEAVSGRERHEIRLASGFCMAVRRSLWDGLGGFDPAFGRGYYEESDFCMRAAKAGWRTIVDDATYVHHHGWGTFGHGGRNAQMKHNQALFEQRWGTVHRDALEWYRTAAPYRDLAIAVDAELDRRYGRVSTAPRRRDVPPTSARWESDQRVERRRPGSATVASRPPGEWLDLANRARTSLRRGTGNTPRALFLVPQLTRTPGAVDLMGLASDLLLRGLDVRIASYGPIGPPLFSDVALLRPTVVDGPDDLLDAEPPPDVVVAAAPGMVYDALLMHERHGSAVASWFEATTGPQALSGWAAAGAASLSPHHFVSPRTRQWLHALEATMWVVPAAVDTDVYLPAVNRDPQGPVVLLVPEGATIADVDAAQNMADLLADDGHDVVVYGAVPDGSPRGHAWLSMVAEARMLGAASVVVEAVADSDREASRLRALAVGTPLVVSGPIAPGSVAHPVRNCYHTAMHDHAGLRRLVRQLADNPSLAEDRVAGGLRAVAAHPWDSMVSAVHTALCSLSGFPPGGSLPITGE